MRRRASRRFHGVFARRGKPCGWRGKRRIHSKPKRIEVLACGPWLEAEIATVRPDVIVALGAVAAQALLGPSFKVTRHRGTFFPTDDGQRVLATVHPSSIPRSPDAQTRRAAMADFVRDLKTIARDLRG